MTKRKDSIEFVEYRENGECYILLDEVDINKLNEFVECCGSGSLAYCVDGDYWLILHKGKWCKRV